MKILTEEDYRIVNSKEIRLMAESLRSLNKEYSPTDEYDRKDKIIYWLEECMYLEFNPMTNLILAENQGLWMVDEVYENVYLHKHGPHHEGFENEDDENEFIKHEVIAYVNNILVPRQIKILMKR